MAVRFNPPPGWQVPAGFRPEPGWSPDPAWPAAPADWPYWVDDAAPPTPPLPGAATPAAPGATTLIPPVPAPAPTVAPAPAPATPPAPSASPALATATPSSASARTRSVARQGAAIPLPAGPLGHLRAPSPSPSGPDTAAGAGTSRKSSSSPWLVPGVAIACFAFGVIIGVVASLVQASDAGQATIDAQRAQAQVIEDREALKAQRSDLEADKTALVEREQDLAAREAAVNQKEAEQVARQNELDELAQQAQQNQQNQQRQQDGRGSGSGFQTCDQLRSNGYQTPIAKGDPGYHRFLDLDGNGVACE